MNQFKISTRRVNPFGMLGLFVVSQSIAGLKTVYADRAAAVGQIAGLVLIAQTGQ